MKSVEGKRYNRDTLEVKYKGKSIYDVLDMTVEEALKFFENVPAIARKIQTLYDVGLSYVKLGQPSTELSGGEAQRIKLATELSKRSTGKTIYILDEPTTGLHFADVHKLIEILRRLSDGGNTVIVIEHNLDVIKTADYIIDMGPEGGDGGGTVIAQGTPEEVAEVPESYTGYYVKKYLEKDKRKPSGILKNVRVVKISKKDKLHHKSAAAAPFITFGEYSRKSCGKPGSMSYEKLYCPSVILTVGPVCIGLIS